MILEHDEIIVWFKLFGKERLANYIRSNYVIENYNKEIAELISIELNDHGREGFECIHIIVNDGGSYWIPEQVEFIPKR